MSRTQDIRQIPYGTIGGLAFRMSSVILVIFRTARPEVESGKDHIPLVHPVRCPLQHGFFFWARREDQEQDKEDGHAGDSSKNKNPGFVWEETHNETDGDNQGARP